MKLGIPKQRREKNEIKQKDCNNCGCIFGVGMLMFPILKQYNAAIALGYFGTRMIECVFLIVSTVSLLLLIPLSQEYITAGVADGSYYQTIETLAIQGHYMAFQMAMLVLGLGSLLFCYLNYISHWFYWICSFNS